jgi:hypothetical protein
MAGTTAPIPADKCSDTESDSDGWTIVDEDEPGAADSE